VSTNLTTKDRLHCGDDRSKLARFNEQKYFLLIIKKPTLERFLP
jgi:hypothetical protein